MLWPYEFSVGTGNRKAMQITVTIAVGRFQGICGVERQHDTIAVTFHRSVNRSSSRDVSAAIGHIQRRAAQAVAYVALVARMNVIRLSDIGDDGLPRRGNASVLFCASRNSAHALSPGCGSTAMKLASCTQKKGKSYPQSALPVADHRGE